jgi:hypothetical protein
MSTSIALPLDDGFLRRECPNCERQFKWHHGPTAGRPADAVDPAVYFCPYCGETAGPDAWWTTDQLEYAQHFALQEGLGEIESSFRDLERQTRGGLVNFKFDGIDLGETPLPLHEPADMMTIEPPCHPWEPFKIDESWTETLHCLLCGAAFAIN